MIVGNLGRKPEVRYLDGGNAVANFSVAATESYTNRSGERVEKVEWFNIEVWEGLAKVAEKYLDKGSLVMIVGKMKTEKYTKDNIERTVYKVRALSMKILSWKDREQLPADQTPQPSTPAQNPGKQTQMNEFSDVSTQQEPDDLPF